jgi:hypothetical protein
MDSYYPAEIWGYGTSLSSGGFLVYPRVHEHPRLANSSWDLCCSTDISKYIWYIADQRNNEYARTNPLTSATFQYLKLELLLRSSYSTLL